MDNFTFYCKKVSTRILSLFKRKSIPFLFINVLLIQLSFGQTDYRSRFNGPRDWNVSTSWQTSFDNGSSWSNASTYPGQNAGSYNVTIQAGHTIEVNTNLTTTTMGNVLVNGTLDLIGGSNPKIITLDTENLTISGGILNFDSQKIDLYLPVNSVIIVENSGDITGGCSNNTEIFIGNKLIAVCQGGGNSGVLTFGEVVTGGGTLNALITTPATNPFTSTINQLITLEGSYSGSTSETVTYEWFVQDPDEIVTSFSTSTSTTYTPTKLGSYLFSFVVSTQVSGSPFSNSETLTVNVSLYFNSDEDNVFNNIDIDDDNDGILDTEECPDFVKPRFLNADFEDLNIIDTGLDGGVTDVVPSLGIWKGDADEIPEWESADLTNNYLEIWHNTQAAGNDIGGQAFSGIQWAEINATTNDGFYQDITTTPGDILQWSFAHRKRTGYSGSANEDIARLLIGDPNGTLTSQGDFSSAGDSSWTEHSGTYTVPAGQTTTRLTFTAIQVASGGGTSSGNFVDKVQLYVIPNCNDTDGDSIPDYFDLDSDNDGIPDVVEAGLANLSDGNGKITAGNFSDTNSNGMHETAESNIILDSDGDGVPNYIDLDSDNDGIFDVDESGVTSSSAPATLQNGDGDINCDGTGDGNDSEVFRYKDSDDNGILETFGDGILDIYDYGTGSNEYGNLSQGTSPLFVKDTDSDGIPDYIDITSNGSTFDIDASLYSSLDANSDGIIDGSTDTDGDGILDTFDTDNTVFGSPRDLNRKLDLYFDGRNDYAEETSVFSSWSEATLMCWIKIDPTATGIQRIIGQDSYYIQLNADKSITINADGNTSSYGSSITTNQWTHITTTYSSANSLLKLFVNGLEVSNKAISGSLSSDSSSFAIARKPDTDSNFFHGAIDEVRVFNKALSTNELQKVVYQEVENNSGTVRGAIIPLDITDFIDTSTITPLDWTYLKRYYKLDIYKDDIIDDLTTTPIDTGIGAKLYNAKLIEVQTAPLPFVTQQSGSLPTAVNIASDGVNGNDAITYDWSIVKVEHDNVTYNANQKHLGLFVNQLDSGSNPIEFSVQNDSELNISRYLKLDGFIDLDGESQLVQGEESVLDVTSTGYIERDQQGTANSFNYNYWSSSVGPIGAGNNNVDQTISGILFDGSVADNGTYPRTINFQPAYTAADSGVSIPINISTYWLYTFNGTSDDYNAWNSVDQTSSIKAGEGYTMKGTSGNIAISTNQNYVFKGKPNNGTITLAIADGDSRLIGNPYSCALDADEFIKDNISTAAGGRNGTTNVFNGAVYFWDYFGKEDSHFLAEYVGGYATYTLMGGAKAYANDIRINNNGTKGTNRPKRYIPVNQGFFVNASVDTLTNSVGTGTFGGSITFKNSQRVFKTEGSGNSQFMKSANPDKFNSTNKIENDIRPKIRLMFNSPKGYHRQLLLGADNNTSLNFDLGYDGQMVDVGSEDMYWDIENGKFVVQGIPEFKSDLEIPLGIIVNEEGLIQIKIDELENLENEGEIFIKDNFYGETYKLNDNPFEISLKPGEYKGRFYLVFQPRLKRIDEIELIKGFNVFMNNETSEIQIKKIIDVEIKSISIHNYIGQILNNWDSNLEDRLLSMPINLNEGAYIIQINTSSGSITKKIIKL